MWLDGVTKSMSEIGVTFMYAMYALGLALMVWVLSHLKNIIEGIYRFLLKCFNIIFCCCTDKSGYGRVDNAGNP